MVAPLVCRWERTASRLAKLILVLGPRAGRPGTPPSLNIRVTARRVPLNTVLLAAIVLTILVGLVPAGIVLDRRIAEALVERARADLQLAPRVLNDRNAAYSDALMMHAKELAHVPGLAAAVARGDRPTTISIVESVRGSLGPGQPLVSAAAAGVHLGPVPATPMVEETRDGRMPVKLSSDGDVIRNIALAPLEYGGQWLGAAGVASPLDATEAAGLKGLTRSEVTITSLTGTMVTASTLDSATALAIAQAVHAPGFSGYEVTIGEARYLVARTALGDAGWVIFAKSVEEELALLPSLRKTAALSALGAGVLALVLGALLARRVSRPVRQLATAATAMRQGSFDAPLPDSQITEVARVAERFDEMRLALRQRLAELHEANAALQDRNARLTALQSDLMQRERLAAAGRLVAQLAHEIRNPIAALRNCLEIVRRRVADDPEGREFADLAIDELLRMHELAEQMLDVSRPRPGAIARCAPMPVARDVARLITAGVPEHDLSVQIDGPSDLYVTMAADALKQVLLNLIQNAREAVRSGTPVRVTVSARRVDDHVQLEVCDNGPGIPAAIRERIFDPFFTTKTALHGVGLGLFVAEGLVRGAGGQLRVMDDSSDAGGARIIIALPESHSVVEGEMLASGVASS